MALRLRVCNLRYQSLSSVGNEQGKRRQSLRTPKLTASAANSTLARRQSLRTPKQVLSQSVAGWRARDVLLALDVGMSILPHVHRSIDLPYELPDVPLLSDREETAAGGSTPAAGGAIRMLLLDAECDWLRRC